MSSTAVPSPPTKAQIFAKRLTSTVILWGLVGTAIALGTPWLWILISGFLGLSAAREWFKMDPSLPAPFRIVGLASAAGWLGVVFTWCWTQGRDWPAELDLVGAVVACIVVWWPVFFHPLAGRETLWAVVYSIAGFFYITWLWSFTARVLFMYGITDDHRLAGMPFLVFAIAATKFTDCGAYAVGSLIGRHKMIPHISPGKTWEGLGGAYLGALVAGMGVFYLYGEQLAPLTTGHAVILCLIIATLCVAGDLAESVVKRCLGVKDSGAMLPGIGGAFDLIDSLLWTVPVFYFYVKYVC